MGPDPQPSPVQLHRKRRHRRRRSSGRRYFMASVLLSLLLLLLIPAASWYRRATRDNGSTFLTPLTKDDLVLSEVSLKEEGAGRSIRGVVRNNSKRRYEDVEVCFTIRSAALTPLGIAVATIKTVESDGSASFETAVPEATALQFLSSITGTPKQD